jgi:hypothetical protein
MTRKVAKQAKWQRRAKKSSKSQRPTKLPPEQTQCKLSPLGRHYHVSSLNLPVTMSSTNFIHIFSPFDNELIKHNLREARD